MKGGRLKEEVLYAMCLMIDGGFNTYGGFTETQLENKALVYSIVVSEDVTELRCRLCQAPLPAYSDEKADGQRYPAWDLIIYRRYGFGVCNPEGPSHWIYKTFHGIPGQHGVSTGIPDHIAFHATVYDGLRAGFVDSEYVNNLENIYSSNRTMYDRYMLGKWVEAEGLVYPGWGRDTPHHPTPSRPLGLQRAHHPTPAWPPVRVHRPRPHRSHRCRLGLH